MPCRGPVAKDDLQEITADASHSLFDVLIQIKYILTEHPCALPVFHPFDLLPIFEFIDGRAFLFNGQLIEGTDDGTVQHGPRGPSNLLHICFAIIA